MVIAGRNIMWRLSINIYCGLRAFGRTRLEGIAPILQHQRLSPLPCSLIGDDPILLSCKNRRSATMAIDVHTITRHIYISWANIILQKHAPKGNCGWRWLLMDTVTYLRLAAIAIPIERIHWPIFQPMSIAVASPTSVAQDNDLCYVPTASATVPTARSATCRYVQ